MMYESYDLKNGETTAMYQRFINNLCILRVSNFDCTFLKSLLYILINHKLILSIISCNITVKFMMPYILVFCLNLPARSRLAYCINLRDIVDTES